MWSSQNCPERRLCLPTASRFLAPRRYRFRPRLEGLEERTVLSTLTVLNTLNKGPGSLRNTITGAKSGDTVVFAPSLDGQTIALTSDQLTINKSLDIEGPGASLLAISGNDTNRVFDLSGGLTVRIAGLTITHGLGAGNNAGGGILNSGSNLTLADDLFSDNVAFGNSGFPSISSLPVGGAVRNRNQGSLSVTDCTFVANQALGRDGGGNAWGGGIANDPGCTAVVTGSTFTSNQAIGGDGGKATSANPIAGHGEGGGIANFGTLTVTGSTFTGNQAIGGNGAVGDTAAVYTIDVANGGGIENFPFGSILFVDGCTFSYNQAIGGSRAVGSPTGQGRLGNGSGGAVKNEAAATITNSAFDHNDAIGGDGNAGGAGDVLVGVGAGGAINNGTVGFPATLTAANLTITNNRAIGGNDNSGSGVAVGAGWGGGLSNRDGSTTTLSDSVLSSNQAIGGAGDAGSGGGNGFGGGAYNDSQSSLTILTSTITGNQATGGPAGSGGAVGLGEGGGLYLADGGVACLDAFTQAHTTNNHATTDHDDIFGSFTTC